VYIRPRRRCSWEWRAGRGAGSSPLVGGPGGAAPAPTAAAPAQAAAAWIRTRTGRRAPAQQAILSQSQKAALWNRNRRNRNFFVSGTGTVTC
jgi:hypothetical protein